MDGESRGSQVILHIPHASVLVPADCRSEFSLSDDELASELLRLTDWYTDELYSTGARQRVVQAPVSRLVVDVERFADDSLETAARVGMGATYVAGCDGRSIRTLSSAQRQGLLDRFYYPHHEALTAAAAALIESYGRCLILDCHSFPTEPLPTQVVESGTPPQVCIGTDPVHTTAATAAAIVRFFSERGYDVALNTPFAGTLVPSAFYAVGDRRAQSVMIELRRDLYMDERTGARTEGLAVLQATLAELREFCETELASGRWE
eukprot:c6702_g1_i1.p1 GENE.c6702_g1_i1~~c6702_g1_i1.p1  ORF type:complete len:264 (+),score=24.51 c6702_g1_i1:70-861(+)